MKDIYKQGQTFHKLQIAIFLYTYTVCPGSSDPPEKIF